MSTAKDKVFEFEGKPVSDFRFDKTVATVFDDTPVTAHYKMAPDAATADGQAVNHPANLVAAYAGLAEIRQMPVADLIRLIAENFRRLFG